MISLLTILGGLALGVGTTKVVEDVRYVARQRSKSGYTPFRR